MADLEERYMREHARLKKKPSSAKDDKRNWRLHILPRIGKQKIVDVTRDSSARWRNIVLMVLLGAIGSLLAGGLNRFFL